MLIRNFNPSLKKQDVSTSVSETNKHACLFAFISVIFTLEFVFTYNIPHHIKQTPNNKYLLEVIKKRGRNSYKLINKYNWEVVRQVRLKPLFMMKLVIMLSMAAAVCLVTLVGLLIVGIILNSNIKFIKL